MPYDRPTVSSLAKQRAKHEPDRPRTWIPSGSGDGSQSFNSLAQDSTQARQTLLSQRHAAPRVEAPPPQQQHAIEEAAAVKIQALVRGHQVRSHLQQTPYQSAFQFGQATQVGKKIDATAVPAEIAGPMERGEALGDLRAAKVKANFNIYHSTSLAQGGDEALLHRRGAQGGSRFTTLYDQESGTSQAERQQRGLQYYPEGGHDMDKNRSWLLGVMHHQVPVRNVAPTALDDMASSTKPDNVSAHTKELLMMASNPNYQMSQGRHEWETVFTPTHGGAPDRTTFQQLDRFSQVSRDTAVQTLRDFNLPIDEHRADGIQKLDQVLNPHISNTLDNTFAEPTPAQKARAAKLAARLGTKR